MRTKYKVVMSAGSKESLNEMVKRYFYSDTDRIMEDGTLVRCPKNWSYRVARNGRHQIVRKENEE